MEYERVLIAFSLTLFAGLATGVGSALAFYAKRTNTTVLSLSLGFSAGVMIYISFIDIFPKAQQALVAELGTVKGSWATVAAFFVGIIFIAVIDKLVPDFENPHEVHRAEEMDAKERAPSYNKLYRMGVGAAIAIAIHNFPEGLATFMSAMKDPKLGMAIAIAIAIPQHPRRYCRIDPNILCNRKQEKSVYLFVPIGCYRADRCDNRIYNTPAVP